MAEKIFDNPDELIAMKQGETTYRFPLKSWILTLKEPNEQYEKIKDLERITKVINERNDELEEINHGLEQALAKEKKEVRVLGEMIQNSVDYKLGLESKNHNLEQALGKSEERVKFGDDREKNLHKEFNEKLKEIGETHNELNEDIKTLKKLLIKEWGGLKK